MAERKLCRNDPFFFFFFFFLLGGWSRSIRLLHTTDSFRLCAGEQSVRHPRQVPHTELRFRLTTAPARMVVSRESTGLSVSGRSEDELMNPSVKRMSGYSFSVRRTIAGIRRRDLGGVFCNRECGSSWKNCGVVDGYEGWKPRNRDAP